MDLLEGVTERGHNLFGNTETGLIISKIDYAQRRIFIVQVILSEANGIGIWVITWETDEEKQKGKR